MNKKGKLYAYFFAWRYSPICYYIDSKLSSNVSKNYHLGWYDAFWTAISRGHASKPAQ